MGGSPRRIQPALGLVCALLGAGWAQASSLSSLELVTPEDGLEIRGPVGLIEVSGRAVRSPAGLYDMVVALDLSVSALYPSGLDVDADGVVGRLRRTRDVSGGYRPHRRWTTDSGDTIARLELVATQRLFEGLESERVRAGLLTFAGRSRVRAPLGPPELALAALERVKVRLDPSGTDLGAATRAALRLFRKSPAPARERILVVLSDGQPTRPAPEIFARDAALRAARRAAEAGVRIFAFALGDEAAEAAETFREMARVSGGEFFRVERPGDVLLELPHVEYMKVASVEIENATTGAGARAVRVFADGSFDAYVPLAAGENRLFIQAITTDGEALVSERTVHYAPSPGLPADLESLAQALRLRTLETELALRPHGRSVRRSHLEVRTPPRPTLH